ncbi:MAG: YraN family protein [Flavobacteriales bacterium]|nr:YraN family protein [Flavobacteriales bacterium]
MEKHLLGRQGELIASTYLLKNGYSILERNWRFGREEIDIIAKKDGFIVFIEVKTRVSSYLEDPVLAVTEGKRKIIIRTANEYILSKDLENESRFDIIGIIHNNKETRIDHVEDAFFPTT